MNSHTHTHMPNPNPLDDTDTMKSKELASGNKAEDDTPDIEDARNHEKLTESARGGTKERVKKLAAIKRELGWIDGFGYDTGASQCN